MAEAWMGAMADIEDAMHDAQVHVECITQDDVTTEPALSPRSLEPPPDPFEQPVEDRPVVGVRQPPPPTRSERPRHRATQWLGIDTPMNQNLSILAREMTISKRWKGSIGWLEAAERWKEQMRQQNLLRRKSIRKGPPAVMTMPENQPRAPPQVHGDLRDNDPGSSIQHVQLRQGQLWRKLRLRNYTTIDWRRQCNATTTSSGATYIDSNNSSPPAETQRKLKGNN